MRGEMNAGYGIHCWLRLRRHRFAHHGLFAMCSRCGRMYR